MTKLADPTIQEFVSGMQLELEWSDDESLVHLHISLPLRDDSGMSEVKRLTMTPVQLDELRGFIMDNID